MKPRCFFRQVGILTARNTEILFNSIGKLVLMVTLPLVCGIIVAFVAGGDMFVSFQDSQTGFFVLCCAVVFTGVFNSIQDICRERSIVKREYFANLRLSAYVCSKLCLQAVICAVQAFLVLLIFYIFSDFSQAGNGVLLPVFLECYITLFLLDLASDATGLFISSIVRTADVANIIAPVFLILQVVFSGVLFSMSGALRFISYFMVGRWAMEALGASGDIAAELRDARDKASAAGKTLEEHELDLIRMYEPEAETLLTAWSVLLLFTLIFSVLCIVSLRRVSKDTR